MSAVYQSFETLAENRIDREKGFINEVCVVRIGEARGHDVFIDDKSLRTVCEVGNSNPEGVKVKLRHSQQGNFQSILEESFGLLKDFRVVGSKVLARLEMLRSLEANMKERAFEMAEKMASQFGLSIDFGGMYEEIGDKKFLRCQKLQSVDLTDKPAATDGLFSMKEPQYESGDSGKHKSDCMCADCDKAKMEAGRGGSGAKPIGSQMETFAAQLKEISEAVAKLTSTAPTQFQSIEARLQQAESTLKQSSEIVLKGEKMGIIKQMSLEAKVATNPDTKAAYTEAQLMEKDIPTLKIIAANAQSLPTSARGRFAGIGGGPSKEFPKGADGKPLKGNALTEAAWEEKYSDIDQMIANSFKN